MERKRVEDLMLPLSEYPNLQYDKSLRDALVVFTESKQACREYRNIIVLNERDEPVGIFSIKDLLKAMMPNFLFSERSPYQGYLEEDSTLSLLWQEAFEDISKVRLNKRLKELTPPVNYTVSPKDPIAKAVYYMVKDNRDVILVVESGKVIGVLRLFDVFREMVDWVLQ
ncbi:MAG: CBS domain-containing protein [Aquificaceae bacterium]|nr:CBS domain-containing protein [Aquificaceae bacterium]MDW8423655.1 CBS domain-containing protein [Aquificaceae bacterium]